MYILQLVLGVRIRQFERFLEASLVCLEVDGSLNQPQFEQLFASLFVTQTFCLLLGHFTHLAAGAVRLDHTECVVPHAVSPLHVHR